jgi:hypothetical protein
MTCISNVVSCIMIEVIFSLIVHQPVCHAVSHPSGTHVQIFVILRHLRVSCHGAPSLNRGWVYNLLIHLLLGLSSSVILGSKSHRTCVHILLSHMRLPHLEDQVPIFVTREQNGPIMPLGIGFLFYPLTICRARVEVF